MTTYQIIARRDVARALRFAPHLTKGALEQELVGATVEAIGGDTWNEIGFIVQLRRPTHQQALDEIAAIVWRYSFYVAEAVVTELAGDAVASAFIETIGDTGPAVLVAEVAGNLTDALVGAAAKRIRRDYETRQDHEGQWSLVRIEQPDVAGSGSRLRPSAA